jgi:hypothetical protein
MIESYCTTCYWNDDTTPITGHCVHCRKSTGEQPTSWRHWINNVAQLRAAQELDIVLSADQELPWQLVSAISLVNGHDGVGEQSHDCVISFRADHASGITFHWAIPIIDYSSSTLIAEKLPKGFERQYFELFNEFVINHQTGQESTLQSIDVGRDRRLAVSILKTIAAYIFIHSLIFLCSPSQFHWGFWLASSIASTLPAIFIVPVFYRKLPSPRSNRSP